MTFSAVKLYCPHDDDVPFRPTHKSFSKTPGLGSIQVAFVGGRAAGVFFTTTWDT